MYQYDGQLTETEASLTLGDLNQSQRGDKGRIAHRAGATDTFSMRQKSSDLGGGGIEDESQYIYKSHMKQIRLIR